MIGDFDAVVIGAGPAGSVSAYTMARRGSRVLLVDKASFPREKVCGCCLNARSLAILDRLGLGDLPSRLGARTIKRLLLSYGSRHATIPLSGSVSLSRLALDQALIERAQEAGVKFLDKTCAAVGPASTKSRSVMLRSSEVGSVNTNARVVLLADGLTGTALKSDTSRLNQVASWSRMGAGVVIRHAPDAYAPGSVYMACSQDGYVGLVRLEDDRLDIAAAMDVGYLREAGGPGPGVVSLLKKTGMPMISGLEEQRWRGTGLLTRSRLHVYDERLLVLGDAAGYVEPFTGEGIAWALTGAEAVVDIAIEGINSWHPTLGKAWEKRYRKLVHRRQTRCRLVAFWLRHPTLSAPAVALLGRSPQLAKPFIRTLTQIASA